jgi:lipopolysaccharide/colanic/teichoic acid biosynthesis glycosyltransferase
LCFKRVILVKSQVGRYGLNNLESMNFLDVLGLQVKHNLLSLREKLTKRTIDMAVSLCGLLLISPVLKLIALIITIDSLGIVFYQQK